MHSNEPGTEAMAETRPRITEEARLLFALMDSADDEGLLRDTLLQARWQQSKDVVERSGYEEAARLTYELLAALDGAHALDGTWISARWRAVVHRVECPPSPPDSLHP